jgi:hypothetical protein
MAYGQKFTPRITTDRFGRSQQLKFAAQAFNKKSGEVMENIYKTYVELGGKTYMIEVSPAKKTKEIRGVEREGMWVKVVKIEARRTGGGSM